MYLCGKRKSQFQSRRPKGFTKSRSEKVTHLQNVSSSVPMQSGCIENITLNNGSRYSPCRRTRTDALLLAYQNIHFYSLILLSEVEFAFNFQDLK